MNTGKIGSFTRITNLSHFSPMVLATELFFFGTLLPEEWGY